MDESDQPPPSKWLRLRKWWSPHWADMRGNAKWDWLNRILGALLCIIGAVVQWLRRGPQWQISSLFIVAIICLGMWTAFPQTWAKRPVRYMALLVFLCLLIPSAISCYQIYVSDAKRGAHSTGKRSVDVAGSTVGIINTGDTTVNNYGNTSVAGAPKKIKWLLPKIYENHPYIICFAGHYTSDSEFGGPLLYCGSRTEANPYEMMRRQGVQIEIKDIQQAIYPAMVARLIGNRASIDVQVPTLNEPIKIESGALPEGWDWNSDSTAMEIVDDQLRVVFQEEYIPTNQVLMRGYIQYESTVLEGDLWSTPPHQMPHALFAPGGFRQIFLYPSEKHPSKRNPNYEQ